MSMPRTSIAVSACALLSVWSLAGGEEIMFSDSFEGGAGRWKSTWGKAMRSEERARTGSMGIKETLENAHGLSVWYTEFDASPGAVYRAEAWVYVPSQPLDVLPALAVGGLNWRTLDSASTSEKDKWVRLELTYSNTSHTRLRLQLFQEGQQAGAGGVVMYWDDVTLVRTLPEVTVDSGIRINPYVDEGLSVTPVGGMKLEIDPGVIDVDGTPVRVPQTVVVELRSPRVIRVCDERRRLTDAQPRSYGSGTGLLGCKSTHITVAGTLDPESLVVKAGPGPDAARFVEGKDWHADKQWAQVARLAGGSIGAETDVYLDYDYSLMRIDTIEVLSDGTVRVKEGGEHKMVPHPPEVDMAARGLCNVFLSYHCTELSKEAVYPIGPSLPVATESECAAKATFVPETHRKLAAGEDVTIVFWGDSVTCGGDASSKATAFPLSFTNWLRAQYPQARIRYVNAGTGGWNTQKKLPLFQEEVLDHKPDLVVIEFVNDMGFSRETIFANYTDAVNRIRAIGGEVIVLTPHFVRPDWMGASGNMRTKETRPAVGFLKEFCVERKVGLADASRRWEHLWVEGIPYLTLLYNVINHPDDRGHRLFVEELKLFFTTGTR